MDKIFSLTNEEAERLASFPAADPPSTETQGVANIERISELNNLLEKREPLSLEDKAKIISNNDNKRKEDIKLGRELERERIIKMLEDLAYIDDDGDEMIGEFKNDLILKIKDESL